ncbi:PhnP Metal-dependent hydrolases of the beta-lactamase superfamily I [Fimbriimonadaceae bacterium]
MARAVILGSGTSNGVPMLGFDYPESFLQNPKNWRTRASLLLNGNDGNVLVDCSPEMRLQLLKADVKDLDSVIITHTHADHVMGMDDLRSLSVKTKRDMPVYILEEYMPDIKRIYPYAFMEFPEGIMVPRFDLRVAQPVMELAGLTIRSFVVRHGHLPCLALRVNDFCYMTDVSEIPEHVWPELAGLDILVLDAVRFAPHPNHFHFDRAMEVAAKIGAKRTILTHLSHDYDHDEFNARLPFGTELAYDGMSLEI